MFSPRNLVILVSLVAFAALGVAAGPAGAGSCPPFDPNAAADGDFAELSQPFVGEGILNHNGAGQSDFFVLDPGEAQVVFVRYHNTDDVPHDIVVQAQLKGAASDYKVKVTLFSNDKDVTDKVLANGRKFRGIAGGGSNTGQLRFRVKRLAGSIGTAKMTVKITGNFDVASTCGDTVKLRANVPV